MTEPIVVCRCYECDCERKARDLSYATSSWLVCMSCCQNRHVYVKERWCPTCDQRLPTNLSVHQKAALSERLARLATA